MNTTLMVNNELLPQGYYFVKCMRVVEEPSYPRPALMIFMKIVPVDTVPQECWNKEVVSIIQPAEKAQVIHDMFIGTFGIENNKYQDGVGRFGVVGLLAKTYMNKKYSQVHYLAVNLAHKLNVQRLIEHEKNNEIPWDNKGVIVKDNRDKVI